MADHSQMLLPCSRAFAGMWTSTSAAEAVQVQSALACNTVNLTWSPATLLLAAKSLKFFLLPRQLHLCSAWLFLVLCDSTPRSPLTHSPIALHQDSSFKLLTSCVSNTMSHPVTPPSPCDRWQPAQTTPSFFCWHPCKAVSPGKWGCSKQRWDLKTFQNQHQATLKKERVHRSSPPAVVFRVTTNSWSTQQHSWGFELQVKTLPKRSTSWDGPTDRVRKDGGAGRMAIYM